MAAYQNARENLDGISIGAFEMAQSCAFYRLGKNPTITVNELPYSKKFITQTGFVKYLIWYMLTYERNAWGNDNGGVVQPATVKAAR